MLHQLDPGTEGAENMGKFTANGATADDDDVFIGFSRPAFSKEIFAGGLGHLIQASPLAFYSRHLGAAADADENFRCGDFFRFTAGI